MPLLTPAQYAKHREAAGLIGGSRAAVKKAIESGRITPQMVEGRKGLEPMIDPAQADAEWAANTRPRVDFHPEAARQPAPVPATPDQPPVAPPEPPAPSLQSDKQREAAAKATMAELDLAERQGALVDRAGVERAQFRTARDLRDLLVETLPARHADEFAAMTDPWLIQCRWKDIMRQALGSLADAALTDAEESDAGL